MNKTNSPDPPASTRLLADCMLGRLAKWLRLMGYDTAYENSASDPHLARRARSEGRVLLTRDRDLATRRGLNTLLIHSETLEEQVQETQDVLGPPPNSALSRCSVCNGVLKAVLSEEVAGSVPPYVLKSQSEFRRCSGCGKIYWPGTHAQKINAQIEKFALERPETG